MAAPSDPWKLYNPRRAARVLKRFVESAVSSSSPQAIERPTPSSWRADRVTLSCLGHATILLDMFGTRLLTDPALVARVGVVTDVATIGPQRAVPPALDATSLPRVDVVALSHAHPDHMDLGTLRLLPRATPLIVPRNTRDIVAELGFHDVREISVGDSIEVAGARVRAVRVRHYGKRHALDRKPGRGYCGYVFEKNGARVFFGGDTAFCELDDDTGPVDVAIFGIGGYDPYVWNHATPEEAWRMAQQLRARWFVPMHYGTFALSDEPLDEPLRRLYAIAGADRARVVGAPLGSTFEMPEEKPSEKNA
jgi:L-ascorbate metabolism protein UlaG (beta-lactamase superfamily)